MSVRHKALLSLFLIAVLWGSAGVVAKLLLREMNIYVILFYRFGIASLLIFPLFLRQPKPKGYLKVLIPFSLLNFFNAIFFYSGLSLTTSNAALIINTSSPLVITLLAQFFIGEYAHAKKFIGIIIGFVGALFIVLLPLVVQGQYVHGDFSGNIFVFAAVLSFAMYAVGSRHLLSSEKYTPMLTASMNFFTLTSICGVLALLSGQKFIVPAMAKTDFILLFLYASIPMTLLTFSLYQWVIKHVSASTASLKDYVQLIVGIGLNNLILGESLSIYYIVGSLLVFIGVFIATSQELSRRVISVKNYFSN